MAREYYYCVGKGQQLKRHIVTPISWRNASCSLDEDFVVLDLQSSDVLLNMLSSDTTGLYSLRLTATTSSFMTS